MILLCACGEDQIGPTRDMGMTNDAGVSDGGDAGEQSGYTWVAVGSNTAILGEASGRVWSFAEPDSTYSKEEVKRGFRYFGIQSTYLELGPDGTLSATWDPMFRLEELGPVVSANQNQEFGCALLSASRRLHCWREFGPNLGPIFTDLPNLPVRMFDMSRRGLTVLYEGGRAFHRCVVTGFELPNPPYVHISEQGFECAPAAVTADGKVEIYQARSGVPQDFLDGFSPTGLKRFWHADGPTHRLSCGEGQDDSFRCWSYDTATGVTEMDPLGDTSMLKPGPEGVRFITVFEACFLSREGRFECRLTRDRNDWLLDIPPTPPPN